MPRATRRYRVMALDSWPVAVGSSNHVLGRRPQLPGKNENPVVTVLFAGVPVATIPPRQPRAKV